MWVIHRGKAPDDSSSFLAETFSTFYQSKQWLHFFGPPSIRVLEVSGLESVQHCFCAVENVPLCKSSNGEYTRFRQFCYPACVHKYNILNIFEVLNYEIYRFKIISKKLNVTLHILMLLHCTLCFKKCRPLYFYYKFVNFASLTV